LRRECERRSANGRPTCVSWSAEIANVVLVAVNLGSIMAIARVGGNEHDVRDLGRGHPVIDQQRATAGSYAISRDPRS
jgi:hypothetical protein